MNLTLLNCIRFMMVAYCQTVISYVPTYGAGRRMAEMALEANRSCCRGNTDLLPLLPLSVRGRFAAFLFFSEVACWTKWLDYRENGTIPGAGEKTNVQG